MFNFESTTGTSGVSQIAITATTNNTYNDIIKTYVLENESSAITFNLMQKAKVATEPYITLNKQTISFDNSGGTKTITVSSNEEWKWDMDEWIGHSIDGGTTGSTLIGLRVEENTGSTRNGTISAWCVSNSAISATTTISQAGNYLEKDIKISPSAFTFDYTATGGTISITANTEWNIYTDARWVTLSAASGSGNTAITFTITANEQSSNRNAIIYVADLNESIVRSCNLVQNGAVVSEPYLSVSPTGATVPLSGGTAVFTVSSNTEWDVYMDDVRSWVTLDNLNGNGNGEVTARVEPYNYDGTRSVDITFINEREGLKSEVTITQEDVMAKRRIYYTSTNGRVVTPYNINAFGGADIVSNTYVNGQGVIEFDRDITEIGASAFTRCTGLTSVIIPNTVTSIGSLAFYNCTGLTGVNLSESLITIGDAVFAYCRNITNITIPNSVTSINQSAFYNCYGLTGVTIGNSVVSIGDSAFYHCTGLTSVNIPNSVTTMGESVFSECSALTSVSLSNSLTGIGKDTFYMCRNLTAITIPSSVTSIGNQAFYYCDKLNYIYSYPTTAPSLGLYAFNYFKSTGTLHYPTGSNYSSWISALPNNWTCVGDLPAQVEESE